MAKQLVNPIERHVEKAVLGIAGLLLVGVIVRFVVTSPNQLELGAELVTPQNIDQKVARQAADIRERIRRAPADAEMPKPLFNDFASSLDPFGAAHLALSLPTAAPFSPEVPIVDNPEAIAGHKKLVKVMPLANPTVIHGRSLYRIEVDDSDWIPAANWATVSALFDFKGQMAEQRREYGALYQEVFFGPPQLQRRERRADGTWLDGDWAFIEPFAHPALEFPDVPSVQLVVQGDDAIVTPDSKNALSRFQDLVKIPAFQMELIRPLMPPIHNGDPWNVPVISSLRDVLMQDDQYLFPDKAPDPDPLNRYAPEGLETSRTVADSEKTSNAEKLTEAEDLLKNARANYSVNDARRAYNTAFTIAKDPTASAADRAKAERLQARADQAEKEIQRAIAQNPNLVHRGPTAEEGTTTREPSPIQQIWIHDGRPGIPGEAPPSVASGTTYQYRARVLILNRLAGEPGQFENKSDAAQVFIASDWTEPIEVTIAPTIEFFVTTADKRTNQVNVEFYQWYGGVWVKERFKFGVGDPLAGAARQPVPGLVDPSVVDRVEVKFDAEMTVVDIDLERVYRDRERGSGRDGIQFDRPSAECCVVLVDAKGRLHERFVATDKNHPAKKEIADRVFKPTGRH